MVTKSLYSKSYFYALLPDIAALCEGINHSKIEGWQWIWTTMPLCRMLWWTTALIWFVWQTVDLDGGALARSSASFMCRGCKRSILELRAEILPFRFLICQMFSQFHNCSNRGNAHDLCSNSYGVTCYRNRCYASARAQWTKEHLGIFMKNVRWACTIFASSCLTG